VGAAAAARDVQGLFLGLLYYRNVDVVKWKSYSCIEPPVCYLEHPSKQETPPYIASLHSTRLVLGKLAY
jgi:hypothetical protein